MRAAGREGRVVSFHTFRSGASGSRNRLFSSPLPFPWRVDGKPFGSKVYTAGEGPNVFAKSRKQGQSPTPYGSEGRRGGTRKFSILCFFSWVTDLGVPSVYVLRVSTWRSASFVGAGFRAQRLTRRRRALRSDLRHRLGRPPTGPTRRSKR